MSEVGYVPLQELLPYKAALQLSSDSWIIYHYLDRIKFYYNSRGSLLEVKHWLHLLDQRVIITKEEYTTLAMLLEKLHYQLNTFIKACYPKK